MTATSIAFFDIWQPGYGGASVKVLQAGTTNLANIYTDEALTQAAANPQVLVDDGNGNGKFAQPVYVGVPFELEINSIDTTGVVRPPLTTLNGEDASGAVAVRTGQTHQNAIGDILARSVHVQDFGVFSTAAGAADNTATLNAAIGAAASTGGFVHLPGGNFTINAMSIPARVVLRGRGRDVTTLQSQIGDKVVTVSGDAGGLEGLTLDGVNLTANSVGLFSKANDEIHLRDVLIKRFVTGLHTKGGRRSGWKDFYIENCVYGARLHGDADAGGGGDGDEFRNLTWAGGRVSTCTSIGVEFSWEDKLCISNTIRSVGFEDNTGTAIVVNGARFTRLEDCWARNNTGLFIIRDDSNTSNAARRENTVTGLNVIGGEYEDGTINIVDTAQGVVFEGVSFKDVDFTIGTPCNNNVLFLDCVEDADVTIAGQGTKIVRDQKANRGRSSGLTTDNTATKAWGMALEPGQIIILEAQVLGRARDAAERRACMRRCFAYRPAATLAYDTQTANFTAGTIVTGQSSGAKARIQADSDSGTTGTLSLIDVSGVFVDNEVIQDTAGGSALANGALSFSNAALDGNGSNVELDGSTNMANFGTVAFVANGPEIELQVTGASSRSVEWDVNVRVMSN